MAFVQKEHLEYPELTMYQMIARIAEAYPEETAYQFYNHNTSYAAFKRRIDRAAKAFYAAGIRENDRITVCLPNTPQALDCFYAINRVGAVANMIHPQSAQAEITFYLNISKSKMILTVDMFYEKVKAALEEVDHDVKILVIRIQDELTAVLKAAYTLRSGRPYLKFPNREGDMLWKNFLKLGDQQIVVPDPVFDRDRTAVILYSGGTTGTSKGICLTDLNFNALALQTAEASGLTITPDLSMLSCMPVFHGFGLGINIHTMLVHGCECILMPTFNIKAYAKMLAKKKPNFIAGVPTIFEALLHTEGLDNVNLSFLRGVFCGGDSLSIELKKKVDAFLHEHGATIQIREGYGLTECVTASCLTPPDTYKEGSIGLPFPDTLYRIVKPGTEEDVPLGEEGEIIISGPTVMKGYLDNPEETADTLRTLSDGRIWMYSGDLGRKDEEGYIFYSQRMKRMIITNGYNVYPGQIENVIDSCPEVSYSCVIGIKDSRRMQRVKAFIVLRDGVAADDACKAKIMETLKKNVAKYAIPREIEFRKELPKTLVGKVAYRVLEEEAEAALAASDEAIPADDTVDEAVAEEVSEEVSEETTPAEE